MALEHLSAAISEPNRGLTHTVDEKQKPPGMVLKPWGIFTISCTTWDCLYKPWDGLKPYCNNGINYQPQLVSRIFCPSTVCIHHVHVIPGLQLANQNLSTVRCLQEELVPPFLCWKLFGNDIIPAEKDRSSKKSVNTVSLQRISFFTLCTGSFNPHARSNLHLTAGAHPKNEQDHGLRFQLAVTFFRRAQPPCQNLKEKTKKNTPNQIIKQLYNSHPCTSVMFTITLAKPGWGVSHSSLPPTCWVAHGWCSSACGSVASRCAFQGPSSLAHLLGCVDENLLAPGQAAAVTRYPPWNQNSTCKIGHPKRKRSYSNHPFSGANCYFQGG